MKMRSGHAPGHVRDAFCNAVEAFVAWKPGEPEPSVEYEVNHEPRQVPVSHMCGLLWNCTDILPGNYFHDLACDLKVGRQTYAAAARAMAAYITRFQK
jgi:hypothetical protein